MDDQDLLLEQLAGLDPTQADPPPAMQSTRYLTILETAVQTVTATPRHQAQAEPSRFEQQPGRNNEKRHLARRPLLIGAAAAITALLAVGALVVPGGTPSAEASILSAAETTADVSAFRATLVRESPDGTIESIVTGEFVGDDVHIDEGTTEFTTIGDTAWQRDADGVVTSGPYEEFAGDRLASFSASSEAVISAVLEGGEITTIGDELVGTTPTTRYTILPDEASRAALRALSPGELAWFELEYPDGVESIDVWIADDLVHQIRVVQNYGDLTAPQRTVTTTTFSDFGGDITIAPLT